MGSVPPTFPAIRDLGWAAALMAMGAMANPATGKPEVNLDHAKHYIDTVDMLLAKTAGVLKASLFQAAYLFTAPAAKAVRTVEALRAQRAEPVEDAA